MFPLRSAGARVAKAAVESGTKVKPMPSPCSTPETTINVPSMSRSTVSICAQSSLGAAARAGVGIGASIPGML